MLGATGIPHFLLFVSRDGDAGAFCRQGLLAWLPMRPKVIPFVLVLISAGCSALEATMDAGTLTQDLGIIPTGSADIEVANVYRSYGRSQAVDATA